MSKMADLATRDWTHTAIAAHDPSVDAGLRLQCGVLDESPVGCYAVVPGFRLVRGGGRKPCSSDGPAGRTAWRWKSLRHRREPEPRVRDPGGNQRIGGAAGSPPESRGFRQPSTMGDA